MKIFYSESQVDYTTYTFNYAIYCVKEQQAELPAIYEKGFLPYSNNLTLTSEIYYLARSLRVNLAQFADTSENRRISRKVEHLDIQLQVIPKASFDIANPTFQAFCLNYAKERFSNNAMDEARFQYIMSRASATHLFEYTTVAGVVGYVLAVLEGGILHYWFAFFETNLLKAVPIGKWIMWRTIKWAKENDLNYVYLGTCYGTSALYKARDFKELEFFDGASWNEDVKLLKTLCKTDQTPKSADLFKQQADQNLFIQNL